MRERIGATLVALLGVLALAGCQQADDPIVVQPSAAQAAVPQPAAEMLTVTGTVQSTDWRDFGATATQATEPSNPDMADVSFVNVPDVPVRVYPLDDYGYLTGPPTATTTTTSTGSYTLVMPPSYVAEPQTEYVVVAGGPELTTQVVDWTDLGDLALRRLVTGLVGQSISPVTEVVYRDVVQQARAMQVDVRTIPATQVDTYYTHYYQVAEPINYRDHHGLANAIAHLERNMAKQEQQLVVERNGFLSIAQRVPKDARRDDDRQRDLPPGQAKKKEHEDNGVRAHGANADLGRSGQRGEEHGSKGKSERDDDDRPAKPAKANGGSDHGNSGNGGGQAAKPKASPSHGNSGHGGGQAAKPKASHGNSGGGGGGEQRAKSNGGGGGDGHGGGKH